MGRIEIVVLITLSIIALPMVASLYTGTVAPFIRRRAPNFSSERQVVLLWGLMLLTAFMFELAVVYLIVKP